MAARHHRGQRKSESKTRSEEVATITAPRPFARPKAYQRNRLIAVIGLLCAWFLYLVYVAFFS